MGFGETGDQLGKSEGDNTLRGNCKFPLLNFKNLFIMEIFKQVKREVRL